MSEKKISWYDLQNLHSSEIKKKYKIESDRKLELGMRHHMDGANAEQRRNFYHEVWDSKHKS